MRHALALCAALAVCRIAFEATPVKSEEASFSNLNETVQRLAQRIDEMERGWDVRKERKDATSSV